ncbi:N-acetyltransferase [soil metagenome]
MRTVTVQPGDHIAIAAAARLFREYAASLPFSLDYQGFKEELALLPGKYGPPRGCIVLAFDDDAHGPGIGTPAAVALGCLALHPILDAFTCELKRMYVAPAARRRGLGALLMQAALREAGGMRYRRMVLDTSADFAAAIALYTAAGFTPCARYNDDPDATTRYFSREI